jgi:hypothetical protein
MKALNSFQLYRKTIDSFISIAHGTCRQSEMAKIAGEYWLVEGTQVRKAFDKASKFGRDAYVIACGYLVYETTIQCYRPSNSCLFNMKDSYCLPVVFYAGEYIQWLENLTYHIQKNGYELTTLLGTGSYLNRPLMELLNATSTVPHSSIFCELDLQGSLVPDSCLDFPSQ